VRGDTTQSSSRGLDYLAGVSAESVGATGICMHLGRIPPGAVAEPHMHEGHETAIYVLSGRSAVDYGPNLEFRLEAGAGEFVFIGAGVPHRPFNLSDTEPCEFVVARTDPSEAESVVLLSHLR